MLKRVLPLPLAALSIVAMTLAGCSGRPAPLQPQTEADPGTAASLLEPGDSIDGGADHGFYPLALGNHWRYQGRIVERASFDGGPTWGSERRYRMRNKLICTESNAGRPYFVERDVQHFEGGDYTQWIRYRQDRSGLFEADVPTNVPPDCERRGVLDGARPELRVDLGALRAFEDPELQAAFARARAAALAKLDLARRLAGTGGLETTARDRGATPEGVETGELTRLAYPLYVGARWLIRRDPRFVSHVVAHESLVLPVGRLAGWKVRIRSELFGPDDHVAFWVSRKGFLKYRFHLEAPITGTSGQVLGLLVVDERRELSGYDIDEPGHSGDPHPTPEPVAVFPE